MIPCGDRSRFPLISRELDPSAFITYSLLSIQVASVES